MPRTLAMKPHWLLPVLLFATTAAATEQPLLVTVTATPPVERVVIDPLAARNAKATKFYGTATLYVDDGSTVVLNTTRTLKKSKKKGTSWKFKLTSRKRTKPKVKILLTANQALDTITKIKLTWKGTGGKVTLKDATKVATGAAVGKDILALHDQDLTTAGLTCQAADCHANQMEKFAPRRDANGKKVLKFHYLKAKVLSKRIFGGQSPRKFKDQNCTVCHKRVKLLAASGADTSGALHLRRMVDTSFCDTCHAPGGIGGELYMK